MDKRVTASQLHYATSYIDVVRESLSNTIDSSTTLTEEQTDSLKAIYLTLKDCREDICDIINE